MKKTDFPILLAFAFTMLTVLSGPLATAGTFNVTVTPSNIYCDDWKPVNTSGGKPVVNTTFASAGTCSYTVASTGGTRNSAIGDFGYAGWMAWPRINGLPANMVWADLYSKFTVHVSAVGKASSGSLLITKDYGQASIQHAGDNHMSVSVSSSPQTSTLAIPGGTVTITSYMTGSGSMLRGVPRTLSVALGFSFSLTDPSIALTAGQTRLNTTQPGGNVAPTVSFQITQGGQALVESLSVDYGDGSPSSVSFSQASSLTFTATPSHVFALDAGEGAKSFQVCATAYGYSDGSTDDDQDSKATTIALLRSPFAILSLEGNLVGTGSVLEVRPGQVLTFDGSPAIGFNEEALLKLDGSQVMQTTSASGLADEALWGALTIPELPMGSDLLLEYMCSNTGSGLNADTWSATLHLVPERVTLSLLVMGSAFLLRRRRSASS